jgi:hypothetical protein
MTQSWTCSNVTPYRAATVKALPSYPAIETGSGKALHNCNFAGPGCLILVLMTADDRTITAPLSTGGHR